MSRPRVGYGRCVAMRPGAPNVRRWMRAGIGLAVAGVLGALFVRNVRLSGLEHTLARVSAGWLALALLAMTANVVFGALRWTWLLRRSRHRVPLVRGVPPAMVARAANDVLPLRGGDVLRAVAARRMFGVSFGVSAGVFAMERLLDGITLGALLTSAVLLSGASRGWLAAGVLVLAGSAAGLIGAAIAGRRPSRLAALRPARLLPGRLRAPAARFATDTARGAGAIASPSGVTVALVLSLGMWALEWVMFVAAAWSVGLHLPLARYALVQAIGNLGLAVPTSPAGAGTFEYVASAAARGVHASPAVVAGYVLVAHAVLVLGSVVLAAPLLLPTLFAAWHGRRDGARRSGGAPTPESRGRAGALRRPCGSAGRR